MPPDATVAGPDGAAPQDTAPTVQYLKRPEDTPTRIAMGAAYVAAHGGPGPFRLAWGILRLRRAGFRTEDYIDYGLWRPGVTRRDAVAFLSTDRNRAFNDALRDMRLPQMDSLIKDKLATQSFLSGLGLPVVPTTAVFRAATEEGAALPSDAQRLVTKPGLAAFLGRIGPAGIFGKPFDESSGRGAFAADPGTSPGTLRFADGREVPVDALAAEIAGSYPRGYLLQPRIRPEAGLREHMGDIMGSLRLVTLMEREGPAVLYAVAKFPAADAMFDSGGKSPRAFAPVDSGSGRILGLRRMDDLAGPLRTHWRNPDLPVEGIVLPHYARACEIVIAGHGALPGHGVLGWDIFLTDEGPLISEVNANPAHFVYQKAAQRGLLQAEPGARLEARRRAVAGA